MKNKFLIIGMFFLSVISFAQRATLKKADKKYKNYEYIEAIALYKKAVEQGGTSVEMLKKLGNSYYFNSDLKDAAKWYEELMALDSNVEPEYFYRYSLCLKSILEYEGANQYLEKFALLSPDDSRAKRFKAQENYLDEIKKQSNKYSIEDAGINSKFDDYGGVFLNDQFVFTTTRDTGSVLKAKHKWTNQAFSDLYSATLSTEGILIDPKSFSKKINSRFYESTAVFTKDGKTIYFTRNNYLKGKKRTNDEKVVLLKLYKATYIDDQWTNITELPFNNNQYSIAHPALSPDNETLYFASDMPGTFGMSDIFKVAINKDGSFGAPENLGNEINTEGRETFPFISEEGELFFASNGQLGLGGLDIFGAKLKEDKTFGEVYNIGMPFNSEADDFCYIIDKKTNSGYFSSSRNGGKGYDDIYKFKEMLPLLSGVVINKETRSIIPNALVTLFDSSMKNINEQYSDEKGQFVFKNLECRKEYVIKVQSKDGFEIVENKYLISTNMEDIEIEMEPEKKMEVGTDLAKKLGIHAIYFDTDRSTIREEAAIELLKIVAVMNQNPNIQLEVRSYTDSRQTTEYNLRLSDRRAKATIKWMINNGIDSSRLIAKGLGESQLVNECSDGVKCSNEKHQQNRRSEFIILKL